MTDPYKVLSAELSGDGILCQFQSRGQLIVSRQQEPFWPGKGNSFWVTHVDGHWYLFTWVPIGYRVPESTNMARLCRTCMGYGKSAMAVVPIPIMQSFGLIELSAEDADAVYREMDRLV
jgi:hypothetical protein